VKALVTGAAGFVGRHLTAHLASCGDEVLGLDRSGTPSIDVTDEAAVRAAFADARPEAVYHLAARSHVGRSWRDAELDAVNVGGTAVVLDACATAGVGRVLVVGSAEEYGVVDPGQLPVGEDAPTNPVTPYGRSKLAAETLALSAYRDRGAGVVCVRAFNHIGPGQDPTFLVPGLAGRVAAAERSGAREIVAGNLSPVRDFTDVRDVVRAYRMLVERGEPGLVYNVCSGRAASVADVCDRLVALAHRRLRVREDRSLVREVDVPVLVGSPARLAAATGWTAERALDATLAEVLEEARRAQAASST